MTTYQVNEAKRIGLNRCIEEQSKGGIFAAALRNADARKVRAENIRRTTVAA